MTDLQNFMNMVSNGDFTKANEDNGNQSIKLADSHDNVVTFIFSSKGEYLDFKISI